MNEINRVIINLDSIKQNILNLRQKAEGAQFYAVVKANGYGLGSVKISKYVEDIVDGYCVSNLEEALALRNAGIKKEILILGFIQEEDILIAAKNVLTISLYDSDFSSFIDDVLEDNGYTIKAHVKIDTGHGRIGYQINEENVNKIVDLFKLKSINIEGIFSHLSTADELDVEYTKKQKEKFDWMVQRVESHGLNFKKKHLSNDAGLIKHGLYYDIVRSGIGMYGFYPSDLLKEEREVELIPSFTWLSRVSFVKDIEAGQAISYGRTFISDKPMKIATVSVGYADGYKRCLSNKAYVLINGQKANVIGNITMDQMMVDVTDIDNVNMKDDVVLIGRSEDEYISIEQLATWAQTISYEIMTSISERVHREYIAIQN